MFFVVGATAYRNVSAMTETANSVGHTHEMKEHIVAILSSLQDAETGQRGFIITGDESYLEPYVMGIREVALELAAIRTLTPNPEQLSKLDELDPLIDMKSDELQLTIELRRNEGFEAAVAVVTEGSGKSVMDDIRDVLADMQHMEDDLLGQREIAAARSVSNSSIVIVVGSS